jgi:signal transduction histidine kinase
MGLAICRKIADRHGGQITARSTQGQGATFVVTLPVEQKTGAFERKAGFEPGNGSML